MTIVGLHPLDALIVALYLAGVLWIGKRTADRTHDTAEFFLASRSLGRFYQFFLNFGTSTNADQAVAVSRETYRQGIGGMWIQFVVLFITPFYWFSTMFFRRVRLTTIGDYFTERFRSPALGGAFAVFMLLFSIVGSGAGLMVAGKTFVALTPKADHELTSVERQRIAEFEEHQALRSRLGDGLTAAERVRYEELDDRSRRGEMQSFASHANPTVFYLAFAVIVCVYTMMGGFKAAAITDAIQGALIIVFSLVLIPLGLWRVGGFSGLHAAVPEHMFHLFGSASLSDYGWYTIVAMVLANLVSIVAVATGMQTAGSARNEMAARVGMIGGMFFKRCLMIGWALIGLLAMALYAGQLHDPDLIWGYMTRDLLVPGAIGLMFVGILAANMSTLDAQSVSSSALFIRNLYEPFRPGRSERHYLMVGRAAIPVTLAGGVLVAIAVNDLLELFKYFITIPAIFGASIWLGFVWRRLTAAAVAWQVVTCVLIYAVIPNVFASVDWATRHEPFLAETIERRVTVREAAGQTDVDQGLAARVGEAVVREVVVAPSAIFFDQIVREDSADPASARIGFGRFNAELWIISWFGVDFTRTPRSWLVALRFFFDALFPFVLLFLLSAVTKPVDRRHLDRFFAKVHTPVQRTAELEARALAAAFADPGQFESGKIWPGSSWEIMKPGWQDYVGFLGSWVLVGVVILLLWGTVSLR